MEQSLMDAVDPKRLQKLPLWDPNNPSKKFNEKEEKYLRELNTYEFMNLEEPGLMHKFSYGTAKNKHTFTFMHGGKYTLPRFIARHVESKSTPIWGWKPDGLGSIEKTLRGRKSRFQLREVYQ